MRIALVFPRSTFLIDPMVYPPLGLWYLAAQLEAQGVETEFFDLSMDKLPEDGQFDQIWISATSPQVHEVRRLGTIVQNYSKTASVLGGPAPWAQRDKLANTGFDLVVAGEADHPQIVRKIIDAAYIAHASSKPQMLYAPMQPTMDHVLAPVRRWSHKYRAYLKDANGKLHRTTTLFTSRGCPMACAFCESGRNGIIWDKHVRYESIELIEQQLDDIRRLGFTGVMFYDDILPLNKPRTLEILRLMRCYGLTWRCFLRTDIIEKQGGYEYLKLMAESGLAEVLAGVESADNRIKTNIFKGTTIEQDTAALEWCKKLNIRFKASLILGLPGETLDSMRRTRDWIFRYRPDQVDVNILIPFPGTPIVEKAQMFDLYWTETLPEEFWYKGPRQESNAIVGTSNLAPQQIKDFRDQLIKDIEAAGIPY